MLDELVDVIETLKSRINEHRGVLQENEIRTRMALIDPLLHELGWDPSDPALVTPEYYVGGKRADYALLDGQDNVVVFLEAKRLNEPLSNHRSQVAAYASELGVKYPALTNGSEWEMYDNSIFVPIEQRRILNVSIADEPSTECAKQFTVLSRSSLTPAPFIPADGTPPKTASKLTSIAASKTFTPGFRRRPRSNLPVTTSEPRSTNWVALRDVESKYASKRPKTVRFPNGEERHLKIWLDVLIETAEWLIRDSALTPSRCPIPDGQDSRKNAIHLQPSHPDDSDFYYPHRLSNGLYLCGRGPTNLHIERCKAIVEHLGKDPATVHVQVG